jgi:hypothetical protein
MRFLVPALRTHAPAAWTCRCSATPATAALARSAALPAALPAALSAALTRSAALSVALTRSPAIPAVHPMILPILLRPTIPAPTTPPAAAGHGKEPILERAGHPGLDDLLQIAGHERDHLDSVRGDHGLQGSRDRPADQDVHALFGEQHRLAGQVIVRQSPLCLVDDAVGQRVNEVDLPGHIEDRRDSIAPG